MADLSLYSMASKIVLEICKNKVTSKTQVKHVQIMFMFTWIVEQHYDLKRMSLTMADLSLYSMAKCSNSKRWLYTSSSGDSRVTSEDNCSIMVFSTGLKTFNQISSWFLSSRTAMRIEALIEHEDAGCTTPQVGHFTRLTLVDVRSLICLLHLVQANQVLKLSARRILSTSIVLVSNKLLKNSSVGGAKWLSAIVI